MDISMLLKRISLPRLHPENKREIMNIEDERRKFAAMAMQGLLSNPHIFEDVASRKMYFPQIAENAIIAADALLMAFERERCKELTSKITELNKKRQQ